MKVNVFGLGMAAGLAILSGGYAHAAQYSAQDLLTYYNLIATGDVTSEQEVDGNVYIGGNLSGSRLQANYIPTAVPAGMEGLANIVIGGTSSTLINLNKQVTVDGETYPSANTSTVVIGGGYIGPDNGAQVQDGVDWGPGAHTSTLITGALPSDKVVDVAMVKTTLDNYALSLANQAASGSYSFTEGSDGQFSTFTGGVYNLTVDQWGNLYYGNEQVRGEIGFDLAEGETVVFNITGGDEISINNRIREDYLTRDVLEGMTEEGYSIAQSVTWNFIGADKVNLNSTIAGTVLAKDATVAVNSTIEGSIYALAVEILGGEVHNINRPGIEPEAPVVPVPATLPLLLGGVGALAALRRRKA